MRTKLAFALAITCAAGASGCAPMAVAGAAGVGVFGVQERTIGQGIDDAAAAADIRSKMFRTDSKAFADVGVQVSEGRVLLSGTVAEAGAKTEAERLAWTVRQTRSVANEIEVGGKTSVMQSAKDDALSAMIRTKMLSDPTVRAVDVDIRAHNGVVYLTGLVGSAAARDRAAEIASLVRGVQRVVCYLDVRETPTIAAGRLRSGAPISMAGQPTN
jgi:osmotically-inducible protein OsmY